jgi:hypothetical protein
MGRLKILHILEAIIKMGANDLISLAAAEKSFVEKWLSQRSDLRVTNPSKSRNGRRQESISSPLWRWYG